MKGFPGYGCASSIGGIVAVLIVASILIEIMIQMQNLFFRLMGIGAVVGFIIIAIIQMTDDNK